MGTTSPIYASSLEQWRSSLSAPQTKLIEWITSRDMAAFGDAPATLERWLAAAIPFQPREFSGWIRFKLHEAALHRSEPDIICGGSSRLYQQLWRSFGRH